MGQQSPLKLLDSTTDPFYSLQEVSVYYRVGCAQCVLLNKQSVGSDGHTVDPLCVLQQRVNPLRANILADSPHNLPRRERFAKDVNRALSASRTHQLPLGDECVSQAIQLTAAFGRCQINPLAQRFGWHGVGTKKNVTEQKENGWAKISTRSLRIHTKSSLVNRPYVVRLVLAKAASVSPPFDG